MQMVEVGIKDAPCGPAQAVAREAVGKGVLAYGGAGGATGLARDRPQRLPSPQTPPARILEPRPTSNGRCPGEGLGGRAWVGAGAPGRCWRRGDGWQLLQARVDAGEPALKHLLRVEQEVPAIRDLHGGRGAQCGTAPCIAVPRHMQSTPNRTLLPMGASPTNRSFACGMFR